MKKILIIAIAVTFVLCGCNEAIQQSEAGGTEPFIKYTSTLYDSLPSDCLRDSGVIYCESTPIMKQEYLNSFKGDEDAASILASWNNELSVDSVEELETTQKYVHIYKCKTSSEKQTEYYVVVGEAYDIFSTEAVVYEVLEDGYTETIEKIVKSMRIERERK